MYLFVRFFCNCLLEVFKVIKILPIQVGYIYYGSGIQQRQVWKEAFTYDLLC